jgi:hypothetical protein
MGSFLAFAPFLIFVVLERMIGVEVGLIAATITAAILLVRDLLGHKAIKVLDAGTLILFGGLTIYYQLEHPGWSVFAVRLRVDLGLFIIVLASMALQKPFTLQYAREQIAPEFWARPEFVRINYVIIAVWAAAFAVMVVAEAVLVYVPTVPSRLGIIVTVLAIIAAVKFTSWYPDRGRVMSS